MTLSADRLSYSYSRVRLKPDTTTEFTLRDVSVRIAPGSLTGLLGPNGCGKTTLLKLLAGVLKPELGSVRLGDREIRTLSPRALAQQIAVVPQETHPAFDFTVMEMVLMGRHPHLGAFQLEGPADIAIAREAMTATGITHLAGRAYMTLSGGEKQRVVIASALAQQPKVLLLDEPTASLDLGYQLEIASLLKQLNRERGVTMVLATHDLNLAASVCDTLVLVREGRVLMQGAAREVLTSSTVEQLYGVIADVSFHERAGHLTVVPVRRQ
ncbi:MAG TPA: ABC transporter ATP-binding protein [Vicinamibacterales bacterium]|nr:ABC transporter ATP-binding protein [Vicinamibacterales bacterium]